VIFVPRQICAEADALIPQPDYRFSSDGCSGLMSWTWWTLTGHGPPWEGCCVVHDFRYWQGGTRRDRREADRALRECVLAKAQDYALIGCFLVRCLAWLIWAAVRIGGGPHLPRTYRWGFGWRYPRGYERET
jgi:hypothetical protein